MLLDRELRQKHYLDLVRPFYDCMSPLYELVWGPSFHFACFESDEPREVAIGATEELVAEYGRFAAGMCVLDIGCGIGGPAATIAAATGAGIIGIDLSLVNVARARERSADLRSSATFIVADAMALPFLDDTFDGIYQFEAGCHMPQHSLFVAECARVLRPGARMVFFDWFSAAHLDRQGTALIEAVCRSFSIPALWSLELTADLMRRNGFSIIAVRDLSAENLIDRNWEPLGQLSLGDVSSAHDLPVVWEFAQAGRALREASLSRAFVVGLVVGEKQG
jgi:ubiquinone/menaquinone biosynthesis C-methylase UbiE